MQLFILPVLLLISLPAAFPAKTKYVVPNSVECISSGLSFNLSKNGSASDMANETGLNVDLYTADQKKVDFDIATGAVRLNYQQYGIIATSVFGSNQRPIMYNIDQPFFAVPKPGFGIGRNYSFTVGCLIPASYHIHVISNTTDDGHGDHGGGIVDPNKHIVSEVLGVRADGTVSLGMPLTYHLGLKDDMYAALVPVSCRYFDPSNENLQMNFVLNRCPVEFPDEEDGYMGTIKRKNAKNYEMHFKAFAFDSNPNSFLGIYCDLQLCVESEIERCYRPCWGPDTPTAAPKTSPSPPKTSQKPIPPTTKEPVPETTEKPEASTTKEPAVVTTKEPEPKTTKSPKISTSRRPEKPTTSLAPKRRKRAAETLKDDVEPVSTTTSQKTLLKVNMPGTDTSCDIQPVCSDGQLLIALYAIIGALAVVTMVLVVTIACLLCVSRRSKVIDQYPTPLVSRGF